MRFPMILVLLAALGACGKPCEIGDRVCAAKAIAANPAKKAAYWKAALDKPVEERIGPASQDLLDLLLLDNRGNRFPNIPRKPSLPADFMADARAAFDELPPAVKRLAAPRLAGIYFVDDLGGTGFTDQAYDAAGNPTVAFVVLDPSVLTAQSANRWATWKESTPFKADPAMRLAARIEDDAQDNRKNAIQYILLHELGHVLSVGARFHPNWNLAPNQVKSTAEFPFFQLSWSIAPEGRYASRFDDAFPQRKDVVYYLGAKLPASAMPETYRRLEETNFPTLYAATHPADDFAEAFASYVHTVVMKRPFEIRLSSDGKVVKTFGACWSEERCAGKRRILEALLASG